MVLTKRSSFPASKYYINHIRWKQIYLESNVSACKIFLGIQFQHSSSGKADGYNFGQQSALKVNLANDIKLSNCEFSHIGMTGLFFANSNRHSIYIGTVRPLLIFIVDTFNSCPFGLDRHWVYCAGM